MNQEQDSHNTLLETEISIDLGQLRALSEDDPEFMIQILEMIADQSPEVMKEMDNCLNNGDFDNLKKAAHKYKSTVNILGNAEIRGLLKSLEEEAELGENKEKIVSLVDTVKTVCRSLMKQLSEELEQLRSAA